MSQMDSDSESDPLAALADEFADVDVATKSGTVVLKRGMTSTRDLWNWFQLLAGGSYSYRLDARITLQSHSGQPVLTWVLDRALPVKFKAADFNGKGTDVGIEELHLAHEGLRLELPGAGAA